MYNNSGPRANSLKDMQGITDTCLEAQTNSPQGQSHKDATGRTIHP